jgi:hypothetical protein
MLALMKVQGVEIVKGGRCLGRIEIFLSINDEVAILVIVYFVWVRK